MPEGHHVDPDSLGPLWPKEVLFEYEEPLTFVFGDREGRLLLAHQLSATGAVSRYLIVGTEQRVIDELKDGRLDLLGALRQPRCWLADIGPDWKVEHLWLIPFDKIPRDLLPKPGSTLTPDLEFPVADNADPTKNITSPPLICHEW